VKEVSKVGEVMDEGGVGDRNSKQTAFPTCTFLVRDMLMSSFHWKMKRR
jgi:hypothetical protein